MLSYPVQLGHSIPQQVQLLSLLLSQLAGFRVVSVDLCDLVSDQCEALCHILHAQQHFILIRCD
jgi:hypothetical protein